MTDKTFDPSRRRLFRQGAAIAGGVALGGLVLKAGAGDQRATQTVAMYQDKPHGTQECDGCAHFVPGKTSTAAGTCSLVQGSISPKGWCVFFAPKG